MEVPYFCHDLNEQDLDKVREVINGPFLTTGEVTTEFERRFAEIYSVKHAIGTTNWTSAAELFFRIIGVRERDEVIVPTMSYVASAHSVSLTGASPVFVDSDPNTGLLDLNQVEEKINDQTRAIMPVHLYGVMADMEELKKMCDQYGIILFEDASHAVISSRSGFYPGQLSDAAAFSFYATKNMTCGEGGVLITNHDDIALKFRQGTCCGITKTAYDRRKEGKSGYIPYDSTFVSGKCNMTNINAALLLGQLDRLKENRTRRAKLVEQYRKQLGELPGITLPEIPEGTESSHYLMVILVQLGLRDAFFEILKEARIGCAVNFTPIHLLSVYRDKGGKEGQFPIAEDWGERCVSLPLYPSLTEEQVDFVVDTIREKYVPLIS
ncbi:DegT/DnrJ/EryC1/StrS family aminotransferase [Patescibacteria group bacterium]|nr:DegT/DnrJ/EryC1/StrS family aminotransferase [Patescibacteria group bacterium]